MSEELWILFMTGSMVCFEAVAAKSQRQSFCIFYSRGVS
jgi:hypothetical protein